MREQGSEGSEGYVILSFRVHTTSGGVKSEGVRGVRGHGGAKR